MILSIQRSASCHKLNIALPPLFLRRIVLTFASLLILLTLVNCAHSIPLLPTLTLPQGKEGVVVLRKRLKESRSQVEYFMAQVDLTYFAEHKRLRGDLTLAVLRPQSLLYEVNSPAGGVLESFATDGTSLQVYTAANNTFLEGPASVYNLDQLIRFAPMHLSASDWVSLLFGEVNIPLVASVDYHSYTGKFIVRYPHQNGSTVVEIDPIKSWVTSSKIIDKKGEIISELIIKERNNMGIPKRLHIKIAEKSVDIRITMNKIYYDRGAAPALYQLSQPRGAKVQKLF